MKEIWKDIRNFEGSYQVSNKGRVRSLDRSVKQGTYYAQKKGRLLKPGKRQSGHVSVVLGRGNTRQVHELVLTTFVGPCPKGKECLHRNGIPHDNVLTNLRWGTRKQNVADAFRHGTVPIGVQKKAAKLTEKDVKEIRKLLKSGLRPGSICGDYEVSENCIYQIEKKLTWKHVK